MQQHMNTFPWKNEYSVVFSLGKDDFNVEWKNYHQKEIFDRCPGWTIKLKFLSQCYVTTMFYSAQINDRNKWYKPATTKNIKWCCLVVLRNHKEQKDISDDDLTVLVQDRTPYIIGDDIISKLHRRGWVLNSEVPRTHESSYHVGK